jgi:dipeptidyl aminopeptidase/acylaminoacyl peptidase
MTIKSLQRWSAGALTLLAGAVFAAAAPVTTTAVRPPIESFFEEPAFTGAKLAPNARALAVRVGASGQRDALAVIDLASNTIKVVARFSDADVGHFQWVNDERLVFNARDKRVGAGETYEGPGLFAVNRDGSAFIQLVSRGAAKMTSGTRRKLLAWNHFLVPQVGAQDSEFVYVTNPHWSVSGDTDYVSLLRLNTLTGRASAVSRPGATRNWLLDHKGEPRIATTLVDNIETIHYRDPATDEWRKLVAFDAYMGGKGGFTPLAFAPDGSLYVSAYGDGDTSELFRYDLARATLAKEALLKIEHYDFNGHLVTTRDQLLGIHYLSDAEAVEWLDANMKALQQRIDALRPGTVNLIEPAARAQTPWVQVTSYSDTQPLTASLFNTETGLFNQIGDTHANIVPAQMGRQEAVRYKARDGLTIPAWLTLPHDGTGKNLPLVVLVHGGPYVRGGSWGWNANAQFLASRGYAVLEPEFRGSTGFGKKHFHAGWKQWGLKMQDDIADGARWAIAEGIVDPKRICIAGASYGGYATLMGLINNPELFKCGIDWVGVTDIALLYTGHWSAKSDLSEGYKKYGMPTLVGDPVKDAAQFEATSPLAQAARIKQPLLLAYGGADQRVPVYHGKKFYEAVKRTNADVESVVYDEEGHGWALPKNRIDFWGRVEQFLERHIGKP